MSNGNEALCQISQERYRNALLWQNLWTMLLFVFGIGLLIFALNLLSTYADADFVTIASKTVATIVDGAAVVWILRRRNKAVEEANVTFEAVEKHCGNKSYADTIRKMV